MLGVWMAPVRAAVKIRLLLMVSFNVPFYS